MAGGLVTPAWTAKLLLVVVVVTELPLCAGARVASRVNGSANNPPVAQRNRRPYPVRGWQGKQVRRGGYVAAPAPTPREPSPPPIPGEEKAVYFEDHKFFAARSAPDWRRYYHRAPEALAGSPWPRPQRYLATAARYLLHPRDLAVTAAGHTSDVLDFGLKRMRQALQAEAAAVGEGEPGGVVGWLRSVMVTVVSDSPLQPSLDMDETYTLDVNISGAYIRANEVWGAIRGLETFSQLVHAAGAQLVVNQTYIQDSPRFPHRGILLDTARHYLSLDNIFINLEAMAMNKMNVFHWHMVDHQSFPYQSKVFPELSAKGAYDPTLVYTQEDIAEVIEQARLRGIRVIPEFDVPDHTRSWGRGREELLAPCYTNNRPDGYYGPMNPIINSTYDFLRDFFTEVLTVFNDTYIHLGGDEITTYCWAYNPIIKAFMDRHKMRMAEQLIEMFEKRLFKIIADIRQKQRKEVQHIVWEDLYDYAIKMSPQDNIIQLWRSPGKKLWELARLGYRTLYSSCWYLDNVRVHMDWDKLYLCDDIPEHLENLLGGEACMWTEYVDNEGVIQRLWPRASAAAERLWSEHGVRILDEAGPRIEEQRCRMMRRGISVGVLSGPGTCHPPVNPGVKRSAPKRGTSRGEAYVWSGQAYISSLDQCPAALVLVALLAATALLLLLLHRAASRLAGARGWQPPRPALLLPRRGGRLRLGLVVGVALWLLWVWIRVWS